MSTLKERKEEFVSGLDGGSIEEINLVTSVSLVSYVCWYLYSDNRNSIWLDFVLNWISMLLSITKYSDNIVLLNLLLIVPAVIFNANNIKNKLFKKQNSNKIQKNDEIKDFALPKIPFLTAYRSSMLVITMIAILAVDFQIFPRRFAKVETWGTSLMDLGVGSFVFSNGIVAARSLLKDKMSPNGKNPLFQRIIVSFRSGGTLLVIGLLRTYFVKNLEYQEHVTEYGVHWNFFLTLAFLPPALVLVDPIAEFIPRVLIALGIGLTYEFCQLYNEGQLLKFMILGPRTNIFNSNREGILSFFGYCSIFLLGQSTGFYILGNAPTKNNLYKPSVDILLNGSSTKQSRRSNIKNNQQKSISTWDRLTTVTPIAGLLLSSLISIAIYQIIMAYHPYNISRRFANLPYCSWVVAYNLSFLSMYCLIGNLLGNDDYDSKVPITLEACNRNGLIMFLLSNVTTGVVNMMIPTIDSTDIEALAILIAYSLFLCGVSMILFKKGWFIKI
ncbi:hypothetical protein TBLA_0C02900 [Henningerozyma blattae CBS 6284]|uniref:GPI-anchored wall transfer protein n=1 Tax=Henningerozyma blattae (strain ATCC 34711 / CBS 6284 / DSM 70876 / NBRC 10599 / NRRL Y-10934 / UCD 77-7) TaxID=1071380 RepID=I2H143_HENB6|nr:hypothetical protein TBLA_0C02900 [Tetrapisispora blattae CBS 6284]CCH60095.1 hypothetical protein TBLA_0C02900 [Tetrapisispora blattae CBS 6284]